jgi:hypothetical protein
VRQLFRLIDWMIDLPAELQQGFREEISRWEKERNMPYLSSIERDAMEKGHVEATQKNIATTLQIKFGAPGKRLVSEVRKINDLDQLEALFEVILREQNLAEIRRLLPR